MCLSRFCNKYIFCNIPEFGNNQQLKSKHMFIFIKYHDFVVNEQISYFGMFLKSEYLSFLKYFVYSRKINKKSAKIIDSKSEKCSKT